MYRKAILTFVLCWAVFIPQAQSVERTASFYVPGLYGDVAIAVALEPGFYALNTSVFYTADAPNPILVGGVDKETEASIISNLVRMFWVPEIKIAGITYMAGVRFQYLDIDASSIVDTPFGDVQIEGTEKGIGDFSFMPVSLFWKSGNLHFNLYEAISVPTAQFDENSLTNKSLNRWVFDTVLSVTWLDPATGTDLSVATGIIYNAENPDTNYKSGLEFHLDFMINRQLTPVFAVGLHGSIYQQLTADSGQGAVQGAFKGRSFSIGPALIYSEKIGNRRFHFSGKWLHEFGAENRLEGDLFLLTSGVKF